MSRKLILVLPLFLFILPFVTALNIGCCCDPVAFTGSLMSDADCAAINYQFIGPPPIGTSCSDFCNASLSAPAGFCGDGVCQAFENITTCPQDCAVVPPSVCTDPFYKKPPQNLFLAPVKGERAFNLSFSLECGVDFVDVYRCEGVVSSCSDKVASLSPGVTSFIDDSSDLKWDQDYTYVVVPFYSFQKAFGDSGIVSGSLGDIECWFKGFEPFCVSDYSYDVFRDYLTSFGYAGADANAFATDFGFVVSRIFGSKFNSAFQCDASNVLSPVGVSCASGEFCVANAGGARCVVPEPCELGFDPFGLFGDVASCEGVLSQRYCFFDKSDTVVDKCYGCNPRMNCYDYKSKGACERDNCGVGSCSWKPVIPDLGIGVCINEKMSNCDLCDKKGSSPVLENFNVSNRILDSCSPAKASALSSPVSFCFYDSDSKTAKTCDDVSCVDYRSSAMCASPSAGIKLADDNSLVSSSSDSCGIGVCQWASSSSFCFKDADADGLPDCGPFDKACELDYFPPETVVTASGFSGRVDFLNIHVLDKISKKAVPVDMAGRPDYFTYFCVVAPNSSCSVARSFPIKVSSSRLVLKNLVLKDGQSPLAVLSAGVNRIKFFSVDPSKNLEVVKFVDVSACDNCAGPTLLNVSVSNGSLIGNTLYTSSSMPVISFVFDEPTKISFVELKQGNTVVPLSGMSSNFRYNYSFTPYSALNGSFTLVLNGYNKKNLFFDVPLNFSLVVDPSAAGVVFSPFDGFVTDKSSVKIQLNFTRPVFLNRVSLLFDDFSDPFVPKYVSKDISGRFSTNDNQSFSAVVSGLKGGRYVIDVSAVGFNNVPVSASSSFFVATASPGIRLVSPSFGVTPYSVFNVTIETSIPGECRYVPSSVSVPPNVSEFRFLKPFRDVGYLHFSDQLSLPFGSNESFMFHAFCKFPKFGIIVRSFDISLDPDPPVIVSAFAEPSVIAEPFVPGSNVFATTLKVQTDKPSFCRFSPSSSSFSQMSGVFPGFDVFPKISNAVGVNVSQVGDYSYFVSCKGVNDLFSLPVSVSFTVDTNLSFNISSSTPRGFSSSNITIGVVANKRAFCYWGESRHEISRCMGACVSGFAHYQDIIVPGPGKYSYFVKCVTGSGEEAFLELPVFVDTTPPVMLYVYDNTTLPGNPDVSWFTNKIRVAFLGNDSESGVSHYLVTLRERDNPSAVAIDNLVSDVLDGEPFFITTTQNGSPLNLSDGVSYRFDVRAVNNVGLKSPFMVSDGVLVDVSKAPGHCFDLVKNVDETDVDCGGSCDACAINLSCLVNSDCVSNFCKDNVCSPARCDDSVLNGFETDVDCGGSVCSPCALNLSCLQDSDCASNYCDPVSKVCIVAPACADGVLGPGETDVDCGGPCERCSVGQSCLEDYDCAEGLVCDSVEKVCVSVEEVVPVVPSELPSRHAGFFKVFFWILLVLLLIGVSAFVVVRFVLKPKPGLERPFVKPFERPSVVKPEKPSPEDELAKLRDFAVEERIEDRDWIPLKELILKKPLPEDRFNEVLEALRRIATTEKIAPKDPLKRLRWMLETLPDELKRDLFAKFKLFKKGLLSKEEVDDLFARLRVTADYYKAHKLEFEKELESYAKPKKRRKSEAGKK